MSRRRSIRKAKYYEITVSVLLGLLVSVLVFLICTLVMCMMDMSYKVTVFMGNMVAASGGFAAGFSFGKRKRRGGIRCGGICALLMTLLFIIASLIFTGGVMLSALLKKMLLILFFSVVGGISGVNTRLKRPPV